MRRSRGLLNKIAPQIDLLQTHQAITLAVDDLFAQLAADNVIYAEVRFAPLLHTRMGLSGEAVVETVLAAMRDAAQTYGIAAGLILCTLRHFDAAASLQTAGLVVNFLGRGVVALDLAADEARYPLANHVAAFRAVREAGGNVIAHAGEARAPTAYGKRWIGCRCRASATASGASRILRLSGAW